MAARSTELARRGWHLKDEAVTDILTEGAKGSVDVLINKVLNTDLKEIGAPWFSEDINKNKLDYVNGPVVLQLQKIRVVSAPRDNEESQTAPKLCRLSLTDGHITCSAVTLESIQGIGVNTAPGTKVLLSGTVEVETSFLLLTSKNLKLLGGRVESLAEPWELKKSLAKQSSSRARGEGGPPPFVPFGKKISKDPVPRRDDFKSLSENKEKKQSERESEFDQQRQAEIKNAIQAKSTSGGVKTFGGGNKTQLNDRDVAKITEMGFSAEQASSALKTSAGNVAEAINTLLSGGQKYPRGGERGRGRGGGRGGGEGGPRRGRRDRDVDDDGGGEPINSRPSGPATLFDFLETKISTKGDAKKSASVSQTSSEGKSGYNYNSAAEFPTPQDKLYNDPRTTKGGNLRQAYDNQNKQRCSYRDGRQQQQESSVSSQENNRCSYRDGPSSQGGRNSGGYSNNREHTSNYHVNQNNIRGGSHSAGSYRNKQEHTSNYHTNQNSNRDYGSGRGRGYQQESERPPRFAKSAGHQRDEDRGSFGADKRNVGRGGGQFENPGGRANQSSYNGRQNRHDDMGKGFDGSDGRLQGSNTSTGRGANGGYRDSSFREQGKFDRSENRGGKSGPFNKSDTYSSSQSDFYQNNSINKSKPVNESQIRNAGVLDNQNQRNDPKFQTSRGRRNDVDEAESVQPSPANDNFSQNHSGPRDTNSRNQVGFNKRENHHRQHGNHQHSSSGHFAGNSYQDGGYANQQMFGNGSPPFPSVRDTVQAKYWEDGQFYTAVVETISPTGNTAVVTFVEYGNQEEVLMTDLKPLQAHHGWPGPMSPHMYPGGYPDLGAYQMPSNFVPPMEFSRRGGNNPSYGGRPGGNRGNDRDRQKQTQMFYVPPGQRG